MNNEFYNNCINQFIKDLIEEKDSISENISNISTYIDFKKDSQDLCNIDLNTINLERNNMAAIYQLIEDLEKLKKKKNSKFIEEQYEKMKKYIMEIATEEQLKEDFKWYKIENENRDDLLNAMFESYCNTYDDEILEKAVNKLLEA